jgi:signal transduction histidine kinase/ligand-binding sensor domain-containing protein
MRAWSLDSVRWRRGPAVVASVLLAAALPASRTYAAGEKLDPAGAYAIRWWTVEDGMATMPLLGVAVAADDAVWCASRSHLMRFDGRRFESLPEAVSAELRTRISDFRALGIAPDGRLWLVGLKGAAVAQPMAAVVHSTLADWAVYSHADRDFWGVAFYPAGLPLFYGMNTLVDFDSTGFVPHALPGLEPLFAYYAALLDRRSSDLWLWGYGRARRIRGGVARADDGPIATRITNLAAGKSGIWAGLVDLPSRTVEGAAVFRDEAWHEYPIATKPSTAAREAHICEGPDGTVWLWTHGAVHALCDGTWRTILEGLPDFSLTTNSLTTDRQGALWAACTAGLLSISRTSLNAAALPPCGVVSIRRDGSLVAGIAGAVVGLAPGTADEAGDSWRHDVIAELPSGVAPTAITETADGTLFVGTRDSFVHAVRSGSSRMVVQASDFVLEVRNVAAMACDSAGLIWAGTANGLARYNPKTDRFDFIEAFIKPTPLPVLGLHAERDGSLLVAVQGRGIERLKPDGTISQEVPTALMPGKRSVQFLRTADGTLWAAGDTGLLRRDSTGQMSLVDTRHGLAERVIVQVAADDAGRLWLAFRDGRLQGLRITDLDELAAGRRSVVRGIVLGPLDGLGDTELLGGLVYVPGRGLIATTSAGIVTVDPARLSVPDTASRPAITVEHMIVDGLSHFRWSNVTTHEFDPPLYQTRLVGVDADWSAPSGETTRAYASIPPGRHRFEARHLRGDTVEDAPAGAVEITVPTPFWKTIWFLATVGVVVAAVAAAGGTAFSRALARRRIAQLEREQERQRDRARIARDIHDSLGAGLAQMAMLSDVMRRGSGDATTAGAVGRPQLDEALDEMFRSAQSLTRAVDEIVWAVNPANDTLRRLFTFLAHDVEELARSGDLELSIEVEDDAPDVGLPSTVRHHLCMLVREAVANVLKHAHATTLGVSLQYHDNAIEISIADDGCGFTPTEPARDGHDGLANMRTRVDELGGSLSIDSSPGSGTRVAIHVTLPAPTHVPIVRPRVRLSGDTNPDGRRTG